MKPWTLPILTTRNHRRQLRLPHATAMIVLGALLLLTPRGARAQVGDPLPSLLPRQSASRFSLTLLGGWSSFAHGPVNDSIRLDNFLLTAPADSGGAGLDEGLKEISDGLGLGVEARLALSSQWSLLVGVQRLYDRSRVTFTIDPGTGPQSGFLEYKVEGYPIYAGLERAIGLTGRLTYRLGGVLVFFPLSRLRVNGSIGGLADLRLSGKADGLGGMLFWGGDYRIAGPWSLSSTVRLRLGRIGDPVDADGDVIQTVFGQELAPMDWSGIDLLVGLTFDFF
jgi:hypothetical protein